MPNLRKRAINYIGDHVPEAFSVFALALLAAVLIASFVISDQSKKDYDAERSAAFTAYARDHQSAVAAIEATYGATDVMYDNNTVTMTIGDKSFHCEGVTAEVVNQKKPLRCIPLVAVDAVAIAAK